jgi:hypothetical protein
VIEDLEWGSYEVEVTDPAYDVAQACENIPYALDPGVDETLTLTLVPAQPQSLRVRVQDSLGAAIPGASVELSRGGYNETFDTTICGQVFFNDGALNSANDYELTVEVGAGAVFTITLSSS